MIESSLCAERCGAVLQGEDAGIGGGGGEMREYTDGGAREVGWECY